MSKTQTLEKPKSNNELLDLSGFDYRKLSGESFAKYQELVQSLNWNTAYDWCQYNAVGIWKKKEDENGDLVDTNILDGILLVNPTPINITRMELRHIEFYKTNNRGRKVMDGLNAQIFDKQNNRANSRYYLLKLPESV